jgi:hypothetical protein
MFYKPVLQLIGGGGGYFENCQEEMKYQIAATHVSEFIVSIIEFSHNVVV